jgi:hypothetical protein
VASEDSTTDDRYRPTRRDFVTALAVTALSVGSVPVSALTYERQEGDGHMAQTVEKLLRENIKGVFSEPDTEKRHKAIAELWAEDAIFIDPDTRYEGREAITRAADAVVKRFPNWVYTELGEIVAYHGIGKLDWGYGPTSAEPTIFGSDVLVMKDDKIAALFAFIDPRKK